MKVEFREHNRYLEVLISEQYSFDDFYALLDRIAEEGMRTHHTNILIDTIRMAGTPQDLERFELGVKTAEVLKPPFIILLLAEAHKINKFGENTANNRGAIELSTSERESGMEWLMIEAHKIPRPVTKLV
jgi:hypothetical protein